MEANCNGVSVAKSYVSENGLEASSKTAEISRPLSSSSSSNSSSSNSLSGDPKGLKDSSGKDAPFIRKFDVFVQYLSPKGIFIIDCKSLVDGRSCSVQREYEDFAGLADLLETLSRRVTITPPLPAFSPASELEVEELEQQAPTEETAHIFYFTNQEAVKTLSELGLAPSQATAFTHYLDAVLRHPLLGSIAQVEEFLTQSRFCRPEIRHEASHLLSRNRAAPNKPASSNLLSYVSSKFGSNRNGTSSSASAGNESSNSIAGDEFYEGQRLQSITFEEKLASVKANLEAVLSSTTKLANVISHLSTCILATLVINSPETPNQDHKTATAFNRAFCASLEHFRGHLEVEGPLTEETLLATLRFLLAYNASFRSMLVRRSELALAYETANRALQRQMDSNGGNGTSKKNFEKAATEKRHAEADFEKFNEAGGEEVGRYQAYRAHLFASSIARYGEVKLRMAKATAEMLKGAIATLKALE